MFSTNSMSIEERKYHHFAVIWIFPQHIDYNDQPFLALNKIISML